MNREQLLDKLVDILKAVDSSDIMSSDLYYRQEADKIITLCGYYYDHCELLESED